MTKKQIRKIAKEIIALERLHNDPNASQDEVARAEKRIIQITSMINSMRISEEERYNIMAEIDIIVQEELEKEKI